MAQKLTAINTISIICEKEGGDIDEIAKCVGLDSRIGGKYLKASLGFGGSCLEKDLKSLIYIAKSAGLTEVADYWQSVLSFNSFQTIRFAKKIVEVLDNCLKGKDIAIMGAAFKGNTSDCRNSKLFEVLNVLLEENVENIFVFDPLVEAGDFKNEFDKFFERSDYQKKVFYQQTSLDSKEVKTSLETASALVFITDHDCFKNANEFFIARIKKKCCVFDGRRILDHLLWKQKEFNIFSIGLEY